MAGLHVVIPTHLPRHLDLVLAGLARQSAAPETVVVSCDTDDPEIGAAARPWAGRLGADLWWVRRPAVGEERLCQVRNNAARHLRDLGHTEGRLLVLDGDMIASRDCAARHAELGARAELVCPYRVDLTAEESGAVDAEAVASGRADPPLDGPRRDALARRDRRARRHLLLRRLRLGPRHKPKLLGGHFSCDLALYLRLNGFDERYTGWGFKDDEFAFRAARVGARVRPAASEIIAWHLHHATRQPDVPMRELPTARRFARRAALPDVAERGVEDPLEQEAPVAERLAP